jgi:SAM-dependent methyltransferase
VDAMTAGIAEIDADEIRILCNYLLGRNISIDEVRAIKSQIEKQHLTKRQCSAMILSSAEFFKTSLMQAPDIHLYYVHMARVKMVSLLLPEAKTIIDLGGAGGSIYELGYPYKFDKITIVDLPPNERNELYKDIEMKSSVTDEGVIQGIYSSMTDLSSFEDASIDFVWSGESLEHISEEDARIVYREVLRVLKPGGWFCLDTPNRYLTEIHTTMNGGGFIHPEHKIEYYPEKLKTNIEAAGFTIVEEIGICEMPNTWKTKTFDYRDFITGNTFSASLNSCYVQFYKCRKTAETIQLDKKGS